MKTMAGTFAKSQLGWVVAAVSVLAACSGAPSPPADEAGLARQALVEFFADLHAGRYARASRAYAGTYEIMVDHNPGQDPADLTGLWRSACTINGARCLEVRSAELLPTLTGGEYRFSVEFTMEDGSLFVQGPCCGGSETDFPPQSSFTYTVAKGADGRFRVVEMPIYVP